MRLGRAILWPALASFLAAAPALAQRDWRQEWERTVASAKQEGQLNAAIATGNVWRGPDHAARDRAAPERANP